MLIPPSASVSTKLLFPVLMWTFSPTNTGKDGSFFVGWHKFCNSSPFFYYTVEKNKLCNIGRYFEQTCRQTSIEITPF